MWICFDSSHWSLNLYVISKEHIIVCGLVKWYEQEEEAHCHGDRHMGVAPTSEVMTPWPLTKGQACSALLDPNALCKATVLPLANVFSHYIQYCEFKHKN